MQYLGEFLSPNNSIAQDQDKLTKHFYFRPDKYDDPNADLENIFIIKEMEQFPKRLDKLAENEAYAIESIEVSKRVSDDQIGVTDVSYVVTATYDLLTNIKKREDSGGGGGGSSSSSSEDNSGTKVDEDGNKVTAETPPWKQRAKWNFQPIEVTVPFTKAYGRDSSYSQQARFDVINSAKCLLLGETKRYQMEITYQKNYKEAQSWEWIDRPYTNFYNFDLNFDYRGSFLSGTLLIFPPAYSREWHEQDKVDKDGQPTGEKELVDYFSYTVKMIYDPEGHDKKFLDVGTYAIFSGDTKPSQIWEVTIVDENGVVENGGQPKYTSASEALKLQAQALKSGKSVNASPVTEPLPLTGGAIHLAAIQDPYNNPYNTISYVQYQKYDFSTLPFKN